MTSTPQTPRDSEDSTMANERQRPELLEHSYDGIQEYDNPMPRWWVFIFWATIVFSLLYVVNVPGSAAARAASPDYEADMAAWKAAHPTPTVEVVAGRARGAWRRTSSAITLGKQVFTTNCCVVPPADARRAHRPESHRQLLDSRRRARRHPQDRVDRGARQGNADLGQAAQAGSDRRASSRTSRRCAARNPPNPKAPEGEPIKP